MSHKKKGKNENRSIILIGLVKNFNLCFALKNLYIYSIANIVETKASNHRSSSANIVSYSHILVRVVTITNDITNPVIN